MKIIKVFSLALILFFSMMGFIFLTSGTSDKNTIETFAYSYNTTWSACADINNRARQGWYVKEMISQNVALSASTGDYLKIIDKELKGEIIIVFERRK